MLKRILMVFAVICATAPIQASTVSLDFEAQVTYTTDSEKLGGIFTSAPGSLLYGSLSWDTSKIINVQHFPYQVGYTFGDGGASVTLRDGLNSTAFVGDLDQSAGDAGYLFIDTRGDWTVTVDDYGVNASRGFELSISPVEPIGFSPLYVPSGYTQDFSFLDKYQDYPGSGYISELHYSLIKISPAPEPSTTTMLSALVGGAAIWRMRQRRRLASSRVIQNVPAGRVI